MLVHLYDVVIIGAGIVGCAAAHALSPYDLKILVLEKESDISCGATKANSGILHAGYDCKPGSVKATLNVQGLEMYRQLAPKLDIPYRNNGSMVICTQEDGLKTLRDLYERGINNKVPKLTLLNGGEAKNIEPNLHPDVKGALLAETACVVSPYEAAIAFAENAAMNNVSFITDAVVKSIETQKENYVIKTPSESYTTRTIINASGIESAAIHNFICEKKESINPLRGQYILLDNTQRDLVSHTIFQLPTHRGKGVLITPSVDYNILIGPTSDESDDTATTRECLTEIAETANRALKSVPVWDKIATFAGIRAKHASKDFVINEPCPGFFNALGIDSPGLTAAPAIARLLADKVTEKLQPGNKKNYQPKRPGIKRFRDLSPNEQANLIYLNTAYGNIICRCETVTEAEITEAIRRPVGARNLDAIKRRTRAQMGRCQGGFCSIRLMEILSKELKISETAVTKDGEGSEVAGI